MDPFTCLSLATSIITVVDFGTKLITTAQTIYRDGLTPGDDNVIIVARDLKRLNETLQSTIKSASDAPVALQEDEKRLKELGVKTAEVAEELITLLESLKGHNGRKHAWRSLRQAIIEISSKQKVSNIKEKLDTFRNELVLRVVVSLKLHNQFDAVRADERYMRLESQTKSLADALLDNRNFFTTGVERITHAQEDERQLSRARHEETIAAIATLQGNFATAELTDDRAKVSLRDLRTIQQDILDFLWFQFMRDRQEEVSAPYNETFEWSHRSMPPSTRAWDNLSSWLARGGGCYWINGKAGSGKSTFMKYLARSPQIRALLEEWTDGEPLLCASFFFWHAGITLQKSQQGLLRTILHESLTQYPELVPIVFPVHSRYFARRRLMVNEPSLVELKDAFKLLTQQRVLPLKICLMIDGVDEYDGDHVQLVKFFGGLSSCQVKFLLSSRPTPECFEAFDGCSTLQLQDLTTNDIRRYVEDNFLAWPRMLEILGKHPDAVYNLFDDIVSKASGVFLWVVLVVKDLGSGIFNHESIKELQDRVNELPNDLNNLYNQMFRRLNPRHKSQASQLLQIMYQSTQIPSRTPMTALRLSFAMENNPDSAVDAPRARIDVDDKIQRCRKIQGLVRSRCCGLLEVREPQQMGGGFGEVHFLHKSVIDFLEQPEVSLELRRLVSGSGFDPNVSLASASLREIKAAEPEFQTSVDTSLIWTILIRCLHECVMAEDSTSHTQELLLEELDTTMNYHWREIGGWIPRFGRSLDDMGHWSYLVPSADAETHWEHGPMPYDSLFALACQFGLHRYVKGVLDRSSEELMLERPTDEDRTVDVTSRLAQSALQRVIVDITARKQHNSRLWNSQVEVVRLAIMYGADVNQPFIHNKSAWHVALDRCNPRDLLSCECWAEILHMLVEAGANINGGVGETMYLTWSYAFEPFWGRNIRLWQLPLDLIREKYLSAEVRASKTSRALAHKILQLREKIQRTILARGGRYQRWVEIEIVNGHGTRTWQELDHELTERVLLEWDSYGVEDSAPEISAPGISRGAENWLRWETERRRRERRRRGRRRRGRTVDFVGHRVA
ncbi:hypothetical protein F4823DRAFT_571536 [Ustulina deusta]|nr:hypothetical protein F4823DRAFT_571536 [Ustulina deusta]